MLFLDVEKYLCIKIEYVYLYWYDSDVFICVFYFVCIKFMYWIGVLIVVGEKLSKKE